MFYKKTITKEDKVWALRTAINLWNNGYYSKSQELCKKYGISSKIFSQALIADIRKGYRF